VGQRASCPLTAAAWFSCLVRIGGTTIHIIDYGSDEGAHSGNWTAVGAAKHNTTGVGLIEVYRIQ